VNQREEPRSTPESEDDGGELGSERADEPLTAEEQRLGRSLDSRLAEEIPDRPTASEPEPAGELVDEDRPDTEGELVSTMTQADADEIVGAAEGQDDMSQLDPDQPAPEEEAVSVRDAAPGGTEDESDGYVRDARRRPD
jgi:hypothetical protein